MFEQLDSLTGQTVVITGANGAIARTTARHLHSLGANIIGIARTDSAELRQFYESASVQGSLHFADITDTNAIKQIVSNVSQCDILINNAGWTKLVSYDDLDGLSDADIDKMIAVNFKAVYTTTREFLPLLRKSNYATVINISSSSANGKGKGSNVIYAASKSAVNSLTKDWARALAPTVRVLSITFPVVVDSEFSGRGIEERIERGKQIPLKRGATTEDIANTIEAYLMKIRYATGVDVIVDGGMSLR